jgi:hypothetical protein
MNEEHDKAWKELAKRVRRGERHVISGEAAERLLRALPDERIPQADIDAIVEAVVSGRPDAMTLVGVPPRHVRECDVLSPAEVLHRAADGLEAAGPAGWFRGGWLAVDVVGVPCTGDDPSAVARCVIGWLEWAAEGYWGARGAVCQLGDRLPVSVAEWSDRHARDVAEVVARMRAAAEAPDLE